MSGTPETRINEFLSNTTAGAIRPQIETLPNGNFLVAYATSVGGPGFFIHGQQFDPDGNAIGAEIDFRFTRAIDEPEFDMLVRPDGQIVISVETTKDDVTITTNGFEIDEAGNASVRFINGISNDALIQAGRNTFNPTLTDADDNGHRLFFTSNRLGQDSIDASARQSDGAIINRNPDPFGGRSDADVSAATLNNGKSVVVLDRDADKGFRSKFDLRFFDENLRQEKLIEIGGGARTSHTTVEALAGGGFVVGWSQLERVLLRSGRQDTEVFVQMFDEDGNATSPKMRVGESRNNDLNLNTSIVALEDGGFIVFYDKNRHEPSLNGQRFDAEGNAIGDEFRVFDGPVGNIDTTLLPGDSVAVSFEAGGAVQTEILEFGEVIRGDDGSDNLNGSGRADLIEAGGGDDSVRGGNGDDLIRGEAGDDTLSGQNGNDRIEGGDGDDTIRGGNGDDGIDGGAGADLLIGGRGSDSFIFRDGDGQDVISDFDARDDTEVIDLSEVSEITSFGDLAGRHMTQERSDVVIDDGEGLQITLRSVNLADLDVNDFVF